MDHQPEHFLKEHGLRHTQARQELLNILLKSEVALSMAEIRERLNGRCDRVTLYRNLKVLTGKGLVHQIVVDNQVSKFMLPDSSLSQSGNYTEHIHFRCIQCERVRCMNDYEIGEIELPEGFRKLECNFVIQGICDECNHEEI